MKKYNSIGSAFFQPTSDYRAKRWTCALWIALPCLMMLMSCSADNSASLQGVWKRDSYPYGTIEFAGNQVKFTVGEGLAEPPEFVGYQLAEDCPGNQATVVEDRDYDFAVLTGEENCDLLNLSGDRFTIYYGGSSEGVTYTKQ